MFEHLKDEIAGIIGDFEKKEPTRMDGVIEYLKQISVNTKIAAKNKEGVIETARLLIKDPTYLLMEYEFTKAYNADDEFYNYLEKKYKDAPRLQENDSRLKIKAKKETDAVFDPEAGDIIEYENALVLEGGDIVLINENEEKMMTQLRDNFDKLQTIKYDYVAEKAKDFHLEKEDVNRLKESLSATEPDEEEFKTPKKPAPAERTFQSYEATASRTR